MTKTLLAVSFLAVTLLNGCVSNRVTNLTVTELPRSANNMYRVEYQWDSTQQTVRPDTIKPFVLVGFDQYEMKPVMKMNNRWEAWIPVPAGVSEVTYSFKVAYQYTGFGKTPSASKRSQEYKLFIK